VTTTKTSSRPRIRLIWDEQLSHAVPRALRQLGFRTTYVGADEDGAPTKGSSDAEVIEFAQKTSQIIVTSNHDMMMLCHEAGQLFIWIDPRGRRLRREEQVLLCFRQIRQWEEILESGMCVRALRTKATPITSAEAERLAKQRFKELRRRQRTASRRKADQGLTSLADWGPNEGWDNWTDSTK